jgi:hypothetical protein
MHPLSYHHYALGTAWSGLFSANFDGLWSVRCFKCSEMQFDIG